MTRRAAALAVDLLAVLAFVLVGRRSHDEGDALLGLLTTLWPFAAGAVVGHALVAAARLRAGGLRAGLVVWPVTVVVGMLLRTASDQGVQLSFVVVTVVVLGVLLLGWRIVVVGARRGGARRGARPPVSERRRP